MIVVITKIGFKEYFDRQVSFVVSKKIFSWHVQK